MLTSLFFLWGFVHNLDPILIPHLKKSFSLSTLQAALVDSSVFVAYFVMALPAAFLIKKYGYKTSIIIGLILFAIGSYLFIPAANTQQYIFFLMALFIIACGLTILETSANPCASLLGDPETAPLRLNFAQSFNGLAATLAPIIGSRLILTKDYTETELSTMSDTAKHLALASEAATVKLPYLILGTVIVAIAIFFAFIKFPEVNQNSTQSTMGNCIKVLRHKHLKAAVLTQFMYVGAQVCVFSFFILYATKAAHIDKILASDYLGWGCGMAFMIGRFWGTFIMKFIAAAKLLTVYAAISFALCILAIYGTGMITIYAVIALAFFMSIMFPTIFALGIKDLGDETELGGSLIFMSIVGGAILPLVFSYIDDLSGNIQWSYAVPLTCFAVVFWFGWKGNTSTDSLKVNTSTNV